MALPDDELFDLLVSTGTPPFLADAAIAAANSANHELPTYGDVMEDSQVTDDDIEDARKFWWMTAPDQYKRILEAANRD